MSKSSPHPEAAAPVATPPVEAPVPQEVGAAGDSRLKGMFFFLFLFRVYGFQKTQGLGFRVAKSKFLWDPYTRGNIFEVYIYIFLMGPQKKDL